MVELVAAPTTALASADLAELRALLDVAFAGAFDDDDWEHTVGGVHLVVREADVVIAHAAVVPRRLVAGTRELSTGYVEGVATRPDVRRRGHASRVLRAAAAHQRIKRGRRSVTYIWRSLITNQTGRLPLGRPDSLGRSRPPDILDASSDGASPGCAASPQQSRRIGSRWVDRPTRCS